MNNESATRREIIDRRLLDAGWNVTDRTQVITEFFVSSTSAEFVKETAENYYLREFSDYVLLTKNGKPLWLRLRQHHGSPGPHEPHDARYRQSECRLPGHPQ